MLSLRRQRVNKSSLIIKYIQYFFHDCGSLFSKLGSENEIILKAPEIVLFSNIICR